MDWKNVYVPGIPEFWCNHSDAFEQSHFCQGAPVEAIDDFIGGGPTRTTLPVGTRNLATLEFIS